MKKILLLAFIASTFASSNVFSVTYNWNGSVSSDWNNPSNWTPAGIPGSADNITIFAAPNNLVLTANQTITNFTLSSGTIDLNGFDLIVNGIATLTNGIIDGINSTLFLNGNTTIGDATLGITCNAKLMASCPSILLRNSTFNNVTIIEKTGASDDYSLGGNIFNDTVYIIKSPSATGYIAMGSANPDMFNGKLFAKNLSFAERIYFANNSSGNQFNDDIEIESSGGNGGIYFGNLYNPSSSATLANGKKISISPGGFSSGDLMFYNFTQVGNAAQNLTITGNGYIRSVNSVWYGPTQFTAPNIYISGTTHNNTARWIKTGSGYDYSPGGNIFNDTTYIIKSPSATGYIAMGNFNPNVFNGKLFAKNLSSAEGIYFSNNTSGNQFNDDIEVESSGGNSGIWFGNLYNPNSSSILANGKKISISPGGFSSGDLIFYKFTQLGNTPQNLTITGNGYIRSQNSVWNGPTHFIAPRIYFSETTHNNTAIWQKTGAGDDSCPGGNVFNGDLTLSNLGTGYLLTSNYGTPDIYNGNVIWERLGSGALYPSYNLNDTYYSNITYAGSGSITAALGGGRVVLSGSNNQIINKTGTNPSCQINKLRINKTSNHVTLQTPLEINLECDFVQGLVNTDATNLLVFLNGSTAINPSNSSFVNGPVRKIGNQAFTFPIGKGGFYRPASISSPFNASDQFTAEYFLMSPDIPGYSRTLKDPSIHHISDCEYWIIDRNNGTSYVTVTLGWDAATSCGITNLSDLLVVRWDGTMWQNHGNGGTTGNTISGTITTSAPVTSFSPFTLASSTIENPLPISLLSFDATLIDNIVKLNWVTLSEINNDYFTVERSSNMYDWEVISKVKGAGNSNSILTYQTFDKNPLKGISYYRLKQTDFNGDFSYSEAVAINNNGLEEIVVYPNPITDVLNIKTSCENCIVKVYSATGQLIYYGNEMQINTNKWAKGIYEVIIINNDDDILYNTKVIK